MKLVTAGLVLPMSMPGGVVLRGSTMYSPALTLSGGTMNCGCVTREGEMGRRPGGREMVSSEPGQALQDDTVGQSGNDSYIAGLNLYLATNYASQSGSLFFIGP